MWSEFGSGTTLSRNRRTLPFYNRTYYAAKVAAHFAFYIKFQFQASMIHLAGTTHGSLSERHAIYNPVNRICKEQFDETTVRPMLGLLGSDAPDWWKRPD